MSEPLPSSVATRLRRIVGSDGVITDPARLLVYESDGLTAYRFAPRAVVLPRETREVGRVVRTLSAADLPFVPRGAGTGLSGGALALENAVVVGTSRMNRILAVDPGNRMARVQPGVINAELGRRARVHGLHYAPDPSSQSACTLGGNVAENSGGPHCLKYGVTSRYVSGLTVVLPDGEAVELGGMGREAPVCDLVGLFVGSEGCFGIATEIEVRLLPLPEGVRTLLAIFEDLEDAGRAVSAIVARGLLPAALEIIDQETIRAVEESVFAAGYPVDAGAALVVEFDGMEGSLDAEAREARECCREAGAREIRTASDEEERAALWKGRKKAFGAMGRIAPDLLVQDATVPRTRLPEVLRKVGEIGRRYDLTVANVFHAGDGNLHPNILFDRRDSRVVERVEAASKEMMEVCVEAGGTITGEHGVGVDKRRYMPLVCSDRVLEAMEGVRRVFDPRGLCNPGKVLPSREPSSAKVRPREGAGEGTANGAPDRIEEGAGVGGEHRLQEGTEYGSIGVRLDELVSGGRGEAHEARSRWAVAGTVPGAVLRPGTAEEVASVLEEASRRRWRVVPAGEGRWLDAGSSTPEAVDLVLTTREMDRILEYEPGDLTLTVEAGMKFGDLQAVCREEGQWIPLDPPGADAGTVGALVATDPPGPLSAGHGRVRDHVLGLTVVTGDGRILELGGKVVKNVAGFDLVKLMTGSGGSLGVITRVTFRLFPRPVRDLTLVFGGEGDAKGRVALMRRVATAAVPVDSLELAEPAPGIGEGASDGAVLIRLLGRKEAVESAAARVRDAARREEDGRLEGVASRELHRSRQEFEEGAGLVLRATAAPSRVGELMRWTAGPGGPFGKGDAGVRLGIHGTLGVLRIAVSRERARDRNDPEEIRALQDRIEGEGGSLAVTRAPAPWRGRVSGPGVAGGVGRLLRDLRSEFDPRGVLGPGRWPA